jgi:uncharacterized protein (DUF983 family)
MAFHESHERLCPHCGERMSATAPRCLNCGRYVDEDDEDDEPAGSRKVWIIVAAVAAAAATIGVAVAVIG